MPTSKQDAPSKPDVSVLDPQKFLNVWLGEAANQFEPATMQERPQPDAVSPPEWDHSVHGGLVHHSMYEGHVHHADSQNIEQRIISQMAKLIQEHECAMDRKFLKQTHDLQTMFESEKKSSQLWFHEHFKRLSASMDTSIQKHTGIGSIGICGTSNSATVLSGDTNAPSNSDDIAPQKTCGPMKGETVLGLGENDIIQLLKPSQDQTVFERVQHSDSKRGMDVERERLDAHVKWMTMRGSKFRLKDHVFQCCGLKASHRVKGAATNWCEKFVTSASFSAMSMCLILTNALWLGVVTDAELAQVHELVDTPAWFLPVGFMFASLFLIEVLCRLVAFRMSFLRRSDGGWNAFDAVVSMCGLVENLLEAMNIPDASLSVLQVLRLMRVIRILRVLRFFGGVRLFIMVLIDNIGTILWGALLMVITSYFVSVFILQGALAFGTTSAVMQLRQHFHTVAQCMYTLNQATLGGILWGEIVKDVRAIGIFFEVLFVFYIIFATLGIFNVVIGLFVEATKLFKKTDRDVTINETMTLSSAFVSEMKILMKDHGFDIKIKDTFNEDEFIAFVQNPDVQMYLLTHGIDETEAIELFYLLDQGKGGAVTVEQFVYGSQRLKGHAKGMDIVLLFEQVNRTQDKLFEFKDKNETNFRILNSFMDKLLQEVSTLRGDIVESSFESFQRQPCLL